MEHRANRGPIRRLVSIILLPLVMLVGIPAQSISTAWTTDGWKPITVENLDRLELVKTLGRGNPQEASLSPDGKWLAVRASSTVWLYPYGEVDQPPQRMLSDDRPITSFVFHPNGEQIVTGHAGGMIKTWDIASRTVSSLFTDDQQQEAVLDLAFSPDGTRFASGSVSSVVLRDAATGEAITTISPNDDYLELGDIQFSPDSSVLVTLFYYWSDDGGESDIRLWNSQTGALLETQVSLKNQFPGMDHILFSPDGKLLVGLACLGEIIRIWNISAPGEAYRDIWLDERITAISFIPDSHTLFLAEQPNFNYPYGRFILHNLDTDETDFVVPTAEITHTITAIAFHPDDKGLVLATEEGFIQLWSRDSSWTDMINLGNFPHFNAHITEVTLTTDHLFVLENSKDGRWADRGTAVRLWDISADEETESLRRDGMTTFSVSPDGKWMAVGDTAGSVLLYDLVNNSLAASWQPFTDRVLAVTFSPDSTQLAAGNGSEGLRIWDLSTYPDSDTKPTRMVEDVNVAGLAFSPDGGTVAIGSSGAVYTWDGQHLAPLLVQSNAETLFEFYAVVYDQSILAAGGAFYHMGSEGSGIYVLNTSGGDYTVLDSPQYPIEDIALGPDHNLLASADAQGVKLWSISSNKLLFEIPGAAADVTFSADARWLIIARRDGILQFWGVMSS
ncbi:MAG TPA: WD40 repeat domain-containing protein [Aggregatilineaceae bacterium]|nr:WD40 repeat domain-containing protein [Aggregatilineaceae bacterium]